MSRIGGPRQARRVSVSFLILALLCLAASILGLVTARPGMAIIGLPLFALMLIIAWGMLPSHVPSNDSHLVAAQERFFRRLGIKWLSGPDKTSPHTRTQRPRRQ